MISKDDISLKKMDKLLSLTSLPKYIVLGNHDWSGNPKAQLEYKSDQWDIDNFYYKKSFKGKNYSLDVFILILRFSIQVKINPINGNIFMKR